MADMENIQFSPEREVMFLTEYFDIPAIRAAELVTGDERAAMELAAAELHRQREADPLADKPVPEASKQDFVADADEDLLKPVLGRQNQRIGAG